MLPSPDSLPDVPTTARWRRCPARVSVTAASQSCRRQRVHDRRLPVPETPAVLEVINRGVAEPGNDDAAVTADAAAHEVAVGLRSSGLFVRFDMP